MKAKRCDACDRFVGSDKEHLEIVHTKLRNVSVWRTAGWVLIGIGLFMTAGRIASELLIRNLR